LFSEGLTTTIRAALRALGIERLTLAIHDASFPSTSDEDIGRGSPYGQGARKLLHFATAIGFDSLQLGPQGDVSESNPSPYDGALFSKNPQSIALATLIEDPLWAPLAAGLLAPVVDDRPLGPSARGQHASAWRAARRVLASLHERFCARPDAAGGELSRRFDAFRARWGTTLWADGLYEALTAQHGSDDWRRWADDDPARPDQRLFSPSSPAEAERARHRRAALAAVPSPARERYLFGQFVLDQQHQAFRAAAGAASLALFGDLQIGFSPRDVWSQRALFRDDYLMGAPPSRTNPAGQPWGYPVLDVDRTPGGTLALLAARIDRMIVDFDGLRVDHPHGLVCPWVYAAADPDPAAAVMRGARLRCSPALPDHPVLAAVAIPALDQLARDPGLARYADDWVRTLRPEQVDRYGLLFDAVMARVRAAGRRESDVVCEVLSTWPYPLRRVMERYGLGRFCVTQKADLARTDDVYRGENASERDWIMVGNHDTPPIWSLADAWHGTAAGSERALALARRLSPRPALRARLARWFDRHPHHLCQGLFAELFVGPARRISVFFADLFGSRDIYNRPGVVHPDNWTLRLPPEFATEYVQRSARGAAFNPPLALALALLARAARPGSETDALLLRPLIDGARQLAPAIDPEIWALLDAALAPS
jgi:4-alpha-glucanotransferase